VIDTSVLVAGIAGFKSDKPVQNPSARFLRDWLENASFTWLVSEEILAEYKEVLRKLGVRRSLIGAIINLLREEAELIEVRSTSEISPDPSDNPFCDCAEEARAAFIVTLNPKDFPQKQLAARVISPDDPIPTTGRRRGRRKH
jgi:putative PIN family toxin of toxin-antitoxin system